MRVRTRVWPVALPCAATAACAGLLGVADVEYQPTDNADANGEAPTEALPPIDATPLLPCSAVTPGVGPVELLDAGLATCPGVSGSVDLANNERHCGECAHACGGTARCRGGICDPDTLVTPDIDGGDFARPLDLDEGALVWSYQAGGRGYLRRTPLDGGATANVGVLDQGVYTLARDDTKYFPMTTGYQLYVLDKSDAANATALALFPEFARIVELGDSIFVTQRTAGQVVRVPKDGTPPSNVTTDVSPDDLVAEPTGLVWTNLADGGNVTRYSSESGAISRSRPLDAPSGLAMDADFIYVYAGVTRQLVRIPRTPLDGPAEVLATVTLPYAPLAYPAYVDARAVYLAVVADTSLEATTLLKIPKCGGTPRVLARTSVGTAALADDTYVYVGSVAGGVLRYTK